MNFPDKIYAATGAYEIHTEDELRRIKKKAPIIIFVLSLTFWSFAYGVAVQRFQLFPFEIIRQAE